MPDDLLVPTFQCAYCHEQLSTAAYAGQGRRVGGGDARAPRRRDDGPSPGRTGAALRFRQHEDTPGVVRALRRGGPRAARHAYEVLRVPRLSACRGGDPLLSDGQRMMLDMQAQVPGNQTLARLRAEGVPCSRCGAKNPVTDEAAVQIVCRFCGAPILLSDSVDTSAVARSRLKLGMNQMFQMVEDDERKQKRNTVIIIVCVITGISIVFLLTFVFHVLPS
jgi:hypothetical protein